MALSVQDRLKRLENRRKGIRDEGCNSIVFSRTSPLVATLDGDIGFADDAARYFARHAMHYLNVPSLLDWEREVDYYIDEVGNDTFPVEGRFMGWFQLKDGRNVYGIWRRADSTHPQLAKAYDVRKHN